MKLFLENRNSLARPYGRRRMYQSVALCLVCGTKQEIIRFEGAMREIDHIKDLHCIKCKQKTKHREAGEAGERTLADVEEGRLMNHDQGEGPDL